MAPRPDAAFPFQRKSERSVVPTATTPQASACLDVDWAGGGRVLAPQASSVIAVDVYEHDEGTNTFRRAQVAGADVTLAINGKSAELPTGLFAARRLCFVSAVAGDIVVVLKS